MFDKIQIKNTINRIFNKKSKEVIKKPTQNDKKVTTCDIRNTLEKLSKKVAKKLKKVPKKRSFKNKLQQLNDFNNILLS